MIRWKKGSPVFFLYQTERRGKRAGEAEHCGKRKIASSIKLTVRE